jgi:hypothetical protein
MLVTSRLTVGVADDSQMVAAKAATANRSSAGDLISRVSGRGLLNVAVDRIGCVAGDGNALDEDRHAGTDQYRPGDL